MKKTHFLFSFFLLWWLFDLILTYVWNSFWYVKEANLLYLTIFNKNLIAFLIFKFIWTIFLAIVIKNFKYSNYLYLFLWVAFFTLWFINLYLIIF